MIHSFWRVSSTPAMPIGKSIPTLMHRISTLLPIISIKSAIVSPHLLPLHPMLTSTQKPSYTLTMRHCPLILHILLPVPHFPLLL